MSEIIGYNDRVILDQYGASVEAAAGSRSSPSSGSGMRCYYCGEHPHPLRDSPASLDRDQMGKLLLATRQALRDLLPWAKG